MVKKSTKFLFQMFYINKNLHSMSSGKSGAVKSVEVMINGSLARLNDLKGANREALYEEYKEWLEIDQYNAINEGVLYCNFLG